MLKNLYNPAKPSNYGGTDHKKMFFDLNDTIPVKVLYNEHLEQDDSWCDMHYEVVVGIVLRGKMSRKYLYLNGDLQMPVISSVT